MLRDHSYSGARDDIVSRVPVSARLVLDVGCNAGRLGRRVKEETGATVVGIEVDPEVGGAASVRLDDVIVGDVEDQACLERLGDRVFDCIICGDVLEHLENPWATLKALAGRLADDGVVLLSMPNIRHISAFWPLFVLGRRPRRDRGIFDRTHRHFFTLRSMRELAREAGLVPELIQRKYRLFDEPRRIDRLCRLIALPGLRELLAYQYLMVCRLKPSGGISR